MKYAFSDNLKINEETLPVISQLAESIPGGFFIYHADGDQELIYFNSHLPSILGCSGENDFAELTGNSFKGIVHPDDMDIQMPVMDGYEATRLIHKLMPDFKAPIIALSANAFAEDKKASKAAGMNDHVAKPINVTELLSVLAKYL